MKRKKPTKLKGYFSLVFSVLKSKTIVIVLSTVFLPFNSRKSLNFDFLKSETLKKIVSLCLQKNRLILFTIMLVFALLRIKISKEYLIINCELLIDYEYIV